MKYLKLFDNYHEYDTKRRSVEISESNFMRLYHKNCKFHDKNKSIPLYRGTENNGEFVSIDPRKSVRRSIESENVHVILMSEMDIWKKYPTYQNSVIGSTNEHSAAGYGIRYELIPYDNSLIALCPSGSIWDSLGGFEDVSRIRMLENFLILIDYEMESWEELKSDILNYGIRLDDGVTIDEGSKNFLLFYKYFKSMKWKGKDVLELPEKTINSEEELVDIFNSIDPHSLIKFIEWLFDPELLGFEIIKYDENYIDNMTKFLETNPISQIWISNPCLMVRD